MFLPHSIVFIIVLLLALLANSISYHPVTQQPSLLEQSTVLAASCQQQGECFAVHGLNIAAAYPLFAILLLLVCFFYAIGLLYLVVKTTYFIRAPPQARVSQQKNTITIRGIYENINVILVK